MDFATIDGINCVLVDIDTNHLFLPRGKRSCCRQPDVTQSDNRNGRKTHSDIRLFFNASRMREHA
ncbi:Uncharacterised protein [Klebsiella pneumoniae]|nr:Uncharacterised protein [Klebsiella pneumoniae]